MWKFLKPSISNLNGWPMGQRLPMEYLPYRTTPQKFSFFVFLLLNPPASPSPTLGFKVAKFWLPPNRKVWHTLFVYVFFLLYSFIVSFIICFYFLLSSIEVWEDCSCLEIEKSSHTFWGSVKLQILLMTCWCHMTKQSTGVFWKDILPPKLFFFCRSKTFKERSIKKILTLIFWSKFDLLLIFFHYTVLQQ